MLWTTHGVNDSGSWVEGFKFCEQLRVEEDMNGFESSVQGSKHYVPLKAMDDMNDSTVWAQGSICYEQLSIIDDMNESRSHELRDLDAMNNYGLLMILLIHGPMR